MVVLHGGVAMNRLRPWTLAALAIVALAVVMLFGRSGAVRAQQPGTPVRPVPRAGFPNFVKLDKYYINLDRVNYLSEGANGELTVSFSAGESPTMNKVDSATLRRVIEAGAGHQAAR